jgi:hypothetical protein
MRLIFCFVILVFLGCSENEILEDNRVNISPKNFEQLESEELIHITYDIGLAILTDFDCDPTKFDLAAATPTVEELSVSMKIMKNGNVRLVLEDNSINSGDTSETFSPPNDMPFIAKTIIEDNEMKLYDSNSSLIRSIPSQSIEFPFFAEKLEETLTYLDTNNVDISSILACLSANVNLDSLLSMINNPPPGIIVNMITDDIFTIRMQMPNQISNSQGQSIVNIVNIEKKLLLGSRLYGNGGQVQQCMIYRYDNNCVLTGFKQEVYEELPDCDKAVTQIFADISHLDFQVSP